MKIVNAERKLVDKLAEECSENIDKNEMISVTLNDMEMDAILPQYTSYYLSLPF